MYLPKKHISRRTFLRGMGATVALPFLDAMVPARTLLAKTAAAGKTRLACIEMVHGAAGSTQSAWRRTSGRRPRPAARSISRRAACRRSSRSATT